MQYFIDRIYAPLTWSQSKTKTLPCQGVITPGWVTGYLYSWHRVVIGGNKMGTRSYIFSKKRNKMIY